MEELKVGFKSGHLEIISVEREDPRGNAWRCRCVCGKEVVKNGSDLQFSKGRKPSKSCGCMKSTRNRGTMTHNRVYSIWYQMNRRCYSTKADNYERYGGKGIGVSDEWRTDYNAFLEWSLANGYKEKLTIDRIDSSKDYSPENCRWVDYYTQIYNRKASKHSKTGMSGVTITQDGRYRVGIKRKNESLSLGVYDDLEKAKEVRRSAEAYFNEHGNLTEFKL